MIVNAYAVLDGFLAALRMPLALLVIGLALHAWRKRRRAAELDAAENRYYLLALLALLLVGLNVVAWPLFYALLQSYVPQWPGVMCMYGVTQIGSGSQGASRFLPGIVATLQIMKPLVVFASGAWLVVYMTNRRTKNSELMPAVIALLLLFAVVSLADAALEEIYLVIPKSERFLAVGCCAVAVGDMERAARFVPTALVQEGGRHWLGMAYFALHAGLPTGLLACRFQLRGKWLLAPLSAALLALPISFLFLVEIAAPKILMLPYHHCIYDLLATAPETAVGIAAFFLGVFAVGWAWLVDRLTRGGVDREASDRMIQRLLFVAAAAIFASMTLFAMELALV